MTTPQLTLYNTLTRTKEAFTPLDASNVRMYVCGPTVYDFAHIGNARPVIVFDLLFRLLKHLYPGQGTAPDGTRVTYVRNITDVDDKINARALRDFPDLPLNEAIRRVTEKTEAQFLSDAERLGNLPPTYQPRATDNIAEMQVLIGNLIQRGHAYEANGEVLFSVQSMPDYGQLSGRNLEDNLAGARIAVDAHKRNPADFVLWKQSSAEEPGWDSPWGRGRPGWHIECSAMSERYLWDEIQDRLSPEAHEHPHAFDIHGGGLDLIFPHHENEIAQSRCAHGTHAMANVWMHNGFLQVEGQKMSKSLGNFYTISQLLETEDFGGRKWSGEVLRLAMLMTHYREPIDFSVRRLEEAAKHIADWSRTLAYLSDDELSGAQAAILPEGILPALCDDLDVGRALHDGLFGNLRFIVGSGSKHKAGLVVALKLLGFQGLIDGTIKQKALRNSDTHADAIAARLAALNAKDFSKADAIRAELAEQGIALMDYKDENGERQTKWEVKR